MKNKQKGVFILITIIGTAFFGCEGMATLFHGPKPEPPPVTYTVTFDANGAEGIVPEAQTINEGTIISLPGKGGMSKGSDIFAGWNESSSGVGTTYSVGASITVTKNMILYAQWLDSSTPQYTVTFNANGATSGSPPSSQTVYSGISITIPGQGTLAYSGKIFGGWNTQANGGGTNYAVGATYTVTGNVTLYAKWQSTVQYTVTYSANGANGTAPTAQRVDPGTVITIPGEGSMSYSGKIFDGWNTQANGSGTNYMEGSSYTVNANISLYAKWVSKPVEVETPGATLVDKLSWLKSNAESYNTYNITLDYDENIVPQSLSYGGKSNITLRMRNAEMRTVSLSSSGALFTVGSGVTLILDSNITLQGRSNNDSSLVRVNSGGTLIMNVGTKITGNTNSSGNSGGGVFVYGGTFTMNGGEISGNTQSKSYTGYPSYGGGGVFVYGGTFTMNDGEISGNATIGYGGGVNVYQGTFTKNGGTIYGSNGDGKSNKVKTNYGALINGQGHAVYANSSPAKRRENTAGPEVYLFFSNNGVSSIWNGGWE